MKSGDKIRVFGLNGEIEDVTIVGFQSGTGDMIVSAEKATDRFCGVDDVVSVDATNKRSLAILRKIQEPT